MFDYSNTQAHQQGGRKTMRHVKIKDGKGYKKVVHYKNGRKIGTAKKPLKSAEVAMIRLGKFIPGLFSDCKCEKKTKTRKTRKSSTKSSK